jgi:hypothetical protein
VKFLGESWEIEVVTRAEVVQTLTRPCCQDPEVASSRHRLCYAQDSASYLALLSLSVNRERQKTKLNVRAFRDYMLLKKDRQRASKA